MESLAALVRRLIKTSSTRFVTEFGDKRVLVVEGDPLIAIVLEDILADLVDVVVEPATALAEGLKLPRSSISTWAIERANLSPKSCTREEFRSWSPAVIIRSSSFPAPRGWCRSRPLRQT